MNKSVIRYNIYIYIYIYIIGYSREFEDTLRYDQYLLDIFIYSDKFHMLKGTFLAFLS